MIFRGSTMFETEKTIDYYDLNAIHFAKTTASVEFEDMQKRFLKKLPGQAVILDFGCGSGRDTKYFLSQGFRVEAVDGSKELCRIASEYTGISVRHMLFQELDDNSRYDGIWACSSILHLPIDELERVMWKMTEALKEKGIIYTSFKYGTFAGQRSGRYFTDMTEKTFAEFLKKIEELMIEELWVTPDVRPGRGDEKWLNMILRKI